MNAIVPINAAPAITIAEVERVAIAIAKGGLFGSKDPNAVLTLCLLAQAEGQHPAVVFRDYHIINGKPAKKAEAMLRDFISSGGKVEWHELSDTVADATFSHPGGGSLRLDWTLKRAQTAGISTPMWRKYPRQMLRSRVISEGVRSVCPSATSGLYEVEEVRDMAPSETPAAPDGGIVEGQFQSVGQLASDAPADYVPMEPMVEEAAPQTKGWREDSPYYPNPSKLHKGLTVLERELAGCGDSDMVYGVTATDEWKEFVRVCELHAPHYLRGGEPAPPEFEGLVTKAERLVTEFDTATANNMTDLARA